MTELWYGVGTKRKETGRPAIETLKRSFPVTEDHGVLKQHHEKNADTVTTEVIFSERNIE